MTTATSRLTRSPGLTALAEPAFRRYFLVSCLSTMGTWVTRFLLGWSAWDLTETATWVGITSALLLLPTFVLSPLFGVLSDRISPRNGLLVTLASQGALAALAALALLSDQFTLPVLLCLATLVGAVSAAHHPLRLALMPRLVPRHALPSAIGISAILFNLSRILGPALAGWLLVQVSEAGAFAVAAGLFCGALLALLRIHGIHAADGAQRGSVGQQLREGLHFVAGHQAIRMVMLLTLVNGFLGRTLIELLPALSGKLLDGTPLTLATLTAAAGAGSITGGLWLARHRSDETALLRMVILSLGAAALVVLPITWATQTWALTLVIFALSLATTAAGTGGQALAQLLVDDAFRGRVLSLWTVVTMGAPAIGAFAMGALADILGFAPVATLFALLSLFAVGALHRSLRGLPVGGD